METLDNTFGKRLEARLVEVCSSHGLLKGTLLSSPDIDEAWTRYAESYVGDAVREFNAWPEFSLACAGYLGMAVAFLWDKDWERHKDVPYSFFLGDRGFDDMDDHITDDILADAEHAVPAMRTVSATVYHFMMKEAPEAGTVEAYRMFLAAAEETFRAGAAIELCRLGYRLEAVGKNVLS